jgi:hypothetical protein
LPKRPTPAAVAVAALGGRRHLRARRPFRDLGAAATWPRNSSAAAAAHLLDAQVSGGAGSGSIGLRDARAAQQAESQLHADRLADWTMVVRIR